MKAKHRKPVMKEHELPSLAKCPYCRYEVECASNVFGQEAPSVGCANVCLKCGEVALFTETLQLRKPSEREMLSLRLNSGVWEIITTTQRAIRHLHNGKGAS